MSDYSVSSCGCAPEIMEARLREQAVKDAAAAPPAPPEAPQLPEAPAVDLPPPAMESTQIEVSDDPRLAQLEMLPDVELFALAAKHNVAAPNRNIALQGLLTKGVTSADAPVAPPAPPQNGLFFSK